ncbi:probable G-protein coupled receptor 139 [Heptranchias perlo]|uniref:probable G-protein coupled receptor 139 n=1 Tax=Heptranchias perlo TaxID=212740 RepID=UPI003559D86B
MSPFDIIPPMAQDQATPNTLLNISLEDMCKAFSGQCETICLPLYGHRLLFTLRLAGHCQGLNGLICEPCLKLNGGSNLMTVVVLSRGNCGLSKCITRYLLGMAVADLLVLIFGVVLYEIKDCYFPFSFLNYTPICSINIALLFMSIDWSVWLTVAFTFDRFVAICHQNFRKKYCTERTAAIVITVVCSLSIMENAPINFVFEPRQIINDVPWSCHVKPSFYTLTIWIAFTWFEIILTPFIPFLLILLFNAQTIRHIVQANRVRRGLRGNNNSEDHNDPEVENRRKSIVLLLTISASFMILWSVTFVFFILAQLTEAQLTESSYNAPFTIMEQTGDMLRNLSSCTNTFIYAVSQSKFREQLRNLITSPVSLIINLFKSVK